MYFKDCKTLQDLKTEYKRLVLQNHPDVGGDTETMKQINNSYEVCFHLLKDTHFDKDGNIYTAKEATQEVPEEFINLMDILIRMENIKIEIIGRFVWISGISKPYKDTLKGLGFLWHSGKLMWYLPFKGYRKLNNKKYTIDEIRYMFGSLEVENELYAKLPAY